MDMFGSLVLVFPTPHEGGALVLRHEGKEWTFDAARVLSATAHYALKRVAYIAFFSDVEHEVLPVTSGHRVTITYNLYWGPPPAVTFPNELYVLYPPHSNFASVGEALAELLADPRFLPEGGTLGFGLRHAYPFETRWTDDMPNPLDKLRGWLKGSDAALFRALQALSLDPLPRLLCESKELYLTVMTDRVIRIGCTYEDDECLALLSDYLGGIYLTEMNPDGTPKPSKGLTDKTYMSYYHDDVKEDTKHAKRMGVYWVTECVKSNSIGSEYVAHGNAAEAGYLYLTPSLFVDIGPAGDRANIEGIVGVEAMRSAKK